MGNKIVSISKWGDLYLKQYRQEAFNREWKKLPDELQSQNPEPSEQCKVIANIINIVTSSNAETIYQTRQGMEIHKQRRGFISFYKEAEAKDYGNKFKSYHRKSVVFKRIAITSPFIIFPLLALYFHNWWLFLGIVFANLGGLLSLIPIFLILAFVITIIYSIKYGFVLNSYFNIMFLSYLYGHITFTLGRHFEVRMEKTKSLMDEEINKLVDVYLGRIRV